MSLVNVVRGGVKIANKITKPLQTSVSYEQYTGTPGGFSVRTYAAVVVLKASVDWKSAAVVTPQGQMTVTRPVLTFLDIPALVAATGGAGISDDDRITLPDGTTGPIRNRGGYMDAGTGQPFATEVMIG